jgi:hypothetical protein
MLFHVPLYDTLLHPRQRPGMARGVEVCIDIYFMINGATGEKSAL